MRERWLLVVDEDGKKIVEDVDTSAEAWDRKNALLGDLSKVHDPSTISARVFQVVEVELTSPISWEFTEPKE